jgi:hypothetical protein
MLETIIHGSTSFAAGGGGGGRNRRSSSSSKNKRIKVMAILWMTGLLCWAAMSFFLPLVLIEFLHHGNDDTTTTASSINSSNNQNVADGPAPLSNANNNNNNKQVVGVHQLVHVTKQLHSQQQHPVEKTRPQGSPLAVSSGVTGKLPMMNKDDTTPPALIGAKRAHVQCNVPIDDSRVAYWNDPVGVRDAHFTTGFNSQQQHEQQETQYITFSPDPGGWNNVSK